MMVILLQLKPEEFSIVDIACGYSHTLLLEQSGTLHLSIYKSLNLSISSSNFCFLYIKYLKGFCMEWEIIPTYNWDPGCFLSKVLKVPGT